MIDPSNIGRIFIGKSGSGYVEINILGGPDEEGWITASIEISAEVWRGLYRANFYSGELSGLAADLAQLHTKLTGTAQLRPIEPFLELVFSGDGKGHVVVKGTAQNQLSGGTMLIFRLELDQTDLPVIVDSLRSSEPANNPK